MSSPNAPDISGPRSRSSSPERSPISSSGSFVSSNSVSICFFTKLEKGSGTVFFPEGTISWSASLKDPIPGARPWTDWSSIWSSFCFCCFLAVFELLALPISPEITERAFPIDENASRIVENRPVAILPDGFFGALFVPDSCFFPLFSFGGFLVTGGFCSLSCVFSPFPGDRVILGSRSFGSLTDPLIRRTRTASTMITRTRIIAGKSNRTSTNPAIRMTANTTTRRTESFISYTPLNTGMLKNIATIYGETIYTSPVIIDKMLAKK